MAARDPVLFCSGAHPFRVRRAFRTPQVPRKIHPAPGQKCDPLDLEERPLHLGSSEGKSTAELSFLVDDPVARDLAGVGIAV